MLLWVCSVIDHRRRQNVVRTSVTHSAIASCATFLFLPHFDVICDLLLNRRTATWNLFVKWRRNPGIHITHHYTTHSSITRFSFDSRRPLRTSWALLRYRITLRSFDTFHTLDDQKKAKKVSICWGFNTF